MPYVNKTASRSDAADREKADKSLLNTDRLKPAVHSLFSVPVVRKDLNVDRAFVVFFSSCFMLAAGVQNLFPEPSSAEEHSVMYRKIFNKSTLNGLCCNSQALELLTRSKTSTSLRRVPGSPE